MQGWLHKTLQSLLDWIEAPGRGPLAAARRLVLTLGLVFVLGMMPWHLHPGRARWWAPAAVALLALLFLAGVGIGSRLGPRISAVMHQGGEISLFKEKIKLQVPDLGLTRGSELVWQLARRIGVVLPALLFFVAWALIYISVWAWHPAVCPADPDAHCLGAFGGFGARPVFGDFLYYAVNMAFANPVPDMIGHGQLVHSLNMVEVMSGIGLASLYAGAFFGVASGEGSVGRSAS